MLTRTLILLGISLYLSFPISLHAQTYANPELKKKVEAEHAAKLKRIQEAPEAYRAQGGIPEDFLKAQAVEKSAPVFYAPPVDVKRADLYKLTAVNAVDVHQKHTSVEMKRFQVEAEGEFQKIDIVLNWETSSWYFIPRDRRKKTREKKFRVEGDRLQFENCRECQDNTFTIVKQTENELVLHLQPQDEGQFFVFSLTFKK